jgi:hypothetical protein
MRKCAKRVEKISVFGLIDENKSSILFTRHQTAVSEPKPERKTNQSRGSMPSTATQSVFLNIRSPFFVCQIFHDRRCWSCRVIEERGVDSQLRKNTYRRYWVQVASCEQNLALRRLALLSCTKLIRFCT